jgi:hypothetical protein
MERRIMNLLQQCKAMLTPHGQIQMSYDRFKNTFGDLGVAKWRAFLMDNNNLPDGTYNGITKVTISYAIGINSQYNFVYFSVASKPYIPPASNSEVWQYGFVNYTLIHRDGIDYDVAAPSVCITNKSILAFKVPNLTTLDEYNAYLAKHPIVLYYYDSSVYTGSIVTADKMDVAHCFYTTNATDTTMPVGTNTDIHDVLGKYHWYGNVGGTVSYKEYDADLMIGAGYNSGDSTNHRVSFKNNAYTLDATGLTQFKANELPRAIVWRS